ncbi:aromatic compounds catabolism [Legionella busanensis]|uniref:Aromatic compounds catabolism n=1 Tax=Legionella busanensis TaxID=190655 RepID=A0A378JJ17_9GAMM|nr:DUF4442 domain-containing protein [Legionella busanensis]STX50313.1 aromatic compounds catabolism [Legionella busanensis]
MTILTRFKFFLWYFGRFQVPLIGYLKPKIIEINDKNLVIQLPLKRRSKNHLNSMYFGALAVGADLAGGLYGFYYANQMKKKISLVFKSFQAQFIKRPESTVYFVCQMGDSVKEMLIQSEETKERINRIIEVQAYTHYLHAAELVATFKLELSIKVLKV